MLYGDGGEVRLREEITDVSVNSLRRAAFSSHVQFMEQFFQSLLPDLTDKEVARLSDLIIEVYKQKKIVETTDFSALEANDFPIMDDLMALVRWRVNELAAIVTKDSNRAADLGDELNDLRNLETAVKASNKEKGYLYLNNIK